MESMYLLIPVSIVLVLVIGGLLAWSVMAGQFDDLDAEGRRILDESQADTKLAPHDDAARSVVPCDGNRDSAPGAR